MRLLLAVVMVGIGVLHFVDPDPFIAIMPPYLPSPRALVLLSGFFEIAGGLGLLWKRVRRAAGLGLVALYIAVFPANLHMALHHLSLGPTTPPAWALWARLPLQLVLIFWALRVSRSDDKAA